jgi:hypothetical protein
VLGGDELGDLVLALVEQLAELEEHLGALGQRECCHSFSHATFAPRDDLVDQLRRGQVEHTGLLAGGGVVDRRGALGRCPPTRLPAMRWVMRVGLIALTLSWSIELC